LGNVKDGNKIWISIVYKIHEKDGSNFFLLYAYGSYGMTIDPQFSSTRLSLLNRGLLNTSVVAKTWVDRLKMKIITKKIPSPIFYRLLAISIDEEYTSENICMQKVVLQADF
jgi:oligopeptidase B